ncbi:hypothetical protein UC35_14900 [Ramlibacter tataouinensis]|uniref:Uncharacterized protein n=1 Tax=Ramlibacter tataouinensis TaxID=94132 RepID=A0A127JVG8_9BURK|nr:hypothetical protein UC35_14900 [Ramlibacter tataouinensis]
MNLIAQDTPPRRFGAVPKHLLRPILGHPKHPDRSIYVEFQVSSYREEQQELRRKFGYLLPQVLNDKRILDRRPDDRFSPVKFAAYYFIFGFRL